MDSRHASIELNLFNHVIEFINHYRNENLDHLVTADHLQKQIKEICQLIYACAHIKVDTEVLLAKKNFLSIDPVPLPSIENDTVLDKKEFKKTIKQIEKIANQQIEADPFYPQLLALFQ